jgi:LPXTG-motif cell wall-anchored protein
MMWARRLIIGSGLAVASLTMLPTVAGAAGTNCTSGGSMTEPGCVTPPNAAGTNDGVTPAKQVPFTGSPGKAAPVSTHEPSSLPFTGADVEQLAVVGAGAVLAGGLLLRRRRHTLA